MNLGTIKYHVTRAKISFYYSFTPLYRTPSLLEFPITGISDVVLYNPFKLIVYIKYVQWSHIHVFLYKLPICTVILSKHCALFREGWSALEQYMFIRNLLDILQVCSASMDNWLENSVVYMYSCVHCHSIYYILRLYTNPVRGVYVV